MLTTNLRLEIEKTNQQFNRWAGQQRDFLLGQQEQYDSKLEEFECTIEALQSTHRELEQSRPLHQRIKEQQAQEVKQVLEEQRQLHGQCQQLEKQLQHVTEEEVLANQQAVLMRQEHERIKTTMEQKLKDFTFGMSHFAKLGLEFQKAANNCMQFNFTQIDATQPKRVFYFIFYVDHDNLYRLVETSPVLPSEEVGKLVTALNQSNNIAKFVFGMRKLFVQSASN